MVLFNFNLFFFRIRSLIQKETNLITFILVFSKTDREKKGNNKFKSKSNPQRALSKTVPFLKTAIFCLSLSLYNSNFKLFLSKTHFHSLERKSTHSSSSSDDGKSKHEAIHRSLPLFRSVLVRSSHSDEMHPVKFLFRN